MSIVVFLNGRENIVNYFHNLKLLHKPRSWDDTSAQKKKVLVCKQITPHCIKSKLSCQFEGVTTKLTCTERTGAGLDFRRRSASLIPF